ncbi:MAG: 4Fe-4S dicluster domain-containing protein [Deltaproteobacteria bacterium]|nr:4Fe-4S dicluster domain-containing protein [Deltaproteobacteria bacterium]MBI3076786.1 4Fe-4S dicluster domain-containing protein [Deltaproteobacteria bacterium]
MAEAKGTPRWGMAIDLDRCTGCQACVVACKQENNVPFSSPEEAAYGREMAWIRVMAITEGEYPKVKTRYLPMLCQQCDNPPSVKVCPTGATYKNPEGIVGQIYPRCIGCRYCANACPYQVKDFNWYNWSGFRWPQEMRQSLNPDVSLRPRGVIEKCTFCHHRLQKARDQAAIEGRKVKSEGEYVPACVQSCPAQAMFFGDLNDPETTIAKLARSSRAFKMLDELGTEPKVIYLKEGEWSATPRE